MPDCFISYASSDGQLAEFVRRELVGQGVSVFLAPVSIEPGAAWSEVIRNNLRASPWVIVLASHAAVGSAWVNQEIGAAHSGAKNIIPIVWDMPPSELPGWLGRYQAIDLRGGSLDQLQQHVRVIAGRISSDNMMGLVILGALLFAVVAVGNSK